MNFLFSARVAILFSEVELFGQFGRGPYEEHLPDFFFNLDSGDAV